MAELHWFPFFAKDWLSSPARMAMKPEQRGAYIDLLAFAWGNGTDEPCLDPDPVVLAGLSGLGRRWAKLSPLILDQFDERDGLLYNAKLSQVWHDSQARHGQAVERGKRSAKARADKRQSVSKQSPNSYQESQSQPEPQERLVAPTEPTSTLPAVALGAEAPRSAVELPVDRDARSAGWSSVRDTLRAIPGLRARPA
jgi:uncharacterized protein YdaU (DUF1376 family)